MINNERGVVDVSPKRNYLPIVFLILLVLLLILVVVLFFYPLDLTKAEKESLVLCGDSTFYDSCSLDKPYYCSEGILIKKASLCGCEEGQKIGEDCIYGLASGEKNVSLKYSLEGIENQIVFPVYSGVANYLKNQSKIVTYSGKEIISRRESNLINIDEETQELFLIPLVKEIQNLGKTKDDQARIAISLVQNIPFGETDKVVIFLGGEVPYTRYPYEVLFENEGICEEKSNLLAFLLRELGYGVSLFCQPTENHASLGIKCPFEKSYKKTGYCFVETTGPSIIGDENIQYAGGIELFTKPEVSLISEGLIFGEENFYEYEDAKKMAKIYSDLGRTGYANSHDFRELAEKYGLAEVYNL